MRRFLPVVVAAAAALVLAGSGTGATPQPVLWDFVDSGLCGFPIHSVGSGTTDMFFRMRGPLGPLGLTTGALAVTATNVNTGASVTIQAPQVTKLDLQNNTFSMLGQTWGLGIGLPYGTFTGSMTFDLDSFASTVNGTFSPYDLCHALAPTTNFLRPLTTLPPWGLPAAPMAGVYANGLIPILGVVAFHVHSHLDLYANGTHVTVPGGIGLVDPTPPDPSDPGEGWFSSAGIFAPLHTHDDTGIIHVEPSTEPFTMPLGDFFDIWQVRLANGCLGASCSGLRAWVNGVRWTGDPRAIPMTAHAEIVLATGPRYPSPVPSSYAFPPGL